MIHEASAPKPVAVPVNLSDVTETIDLRNQSTGTVVEIVPVDPVGARPSVVRAVIDAKELEYRTFLDAGYVSSLAELHEELEAYSSASWFLIARDEDAEVAGVARVINPTAAGLKTLNDMEARRLDASFANAARFSFAESFEIATLSVSKKHRHSSTALNLYGAIIAKSIAEARPTVVASFDDGKSASYLREFESLFPEGITRLGHARDFMGTPTTPVCISVPDLLAGMSHQPAIVHALRSVTLVTSTYAQGSSRLIAS